MIPVKEIKIERAEGPTNLCVEKIFTNWEDATRWMYSQSHTFPENGGYDKHDLSVKWEDGTVIGMRLDAKHVSCEDNDLDVAGRVLRCVNFYSGKKKPSRLTDEKYQEFLNTQPSEWVEVCKHVADHCEIGRYNKK